MLTIDSRFKIEQSTSRRMRSREIGRNVLLNEIHCVACSTSSARPQAEFCDYVIYGKFTRQPSPFSTVILLTYGLLSLPADSDQFTVVHNARLVICDRVFLARFESRSVEKVVVQTFWKSRKEESRVGPTSFASREFWKSQLAI